MAGMPTVKQMITQAPMNMSPPIVGVPSLDMCHVGPSRLMLCPALMLRSHGTRKNPMIAVMI